MDFYHARSFRLTLFFFFFGLAIYIMLSSPKIQYKLQSYRTFRNRDFLFHFSFDTESCAGSCAELARSSFLTFAIVKENRVYFWAHRSKVSEISTSTNSEVTELNFALKLKSRCTPFVNTVVITFEIQKSEYNTAK